MPPKKKNKKSKEESKKEEVPEPQPRTKITSSIVSSDTIVLDKSTIKQLKNTLYFNCPACSTLLKL